MSNTFGKEFHADKWKWFVFCFQANWNELSCQLLKLKFWMVYLQETKKSGKKMGDWSKLKNNNKTKSTAFWQWERWLSFFRVLTAKNGPKPRQLRIQKSSSVHCVQSVYFHIATYTNKNDEYVSEASIFFSSVRLCVYDRPKQTKIYGFPQHAASLYCYFQPSSFDLFYTYQYTHTLAHTHTPMRVNIKYLNVYEKYIDDSSTWWTRYGPCM